MAAFAEKEVQNTGWLPEPVRISEIQPDEDGFSVDESENEIENRGAQ
jgi:hypothetical protein